jgi:hypothetical protein
VIERREVLDQFDPSLLEHAEIEQRVDALDLSTDANTYARRG